MQGAWRVKKTLLFIKEMTNSTDPETITCGFCFRTSAYMENPKILPECSHIHCLGCLQSLSTSVGFVRCPHQDCRYWEGSLEDLSPFSSPSQTIFCDKLPCDQPATVFWTESEKNYCSLCEEGVREWAMGQILSIADNRQRLVKLLTRLCTKHDAQSSDRTDRVFRYASRDLSVFCSLCSLERQNSNDQIPPKISEVVRDFTNELNELDRRLDEKMQKLCKLSDETQRSIDDYARDTEEMENALNKAKQEQIDMISRKYDDLRQNLLTKRGESLEMLKSFSEDTLKDSQFDIHLAKRKIQSHLAYKHEVDIVKDHGEVKSHTNTLLATRLPRLPFNDLKLERLHENRNLELRDLSNSITISLGVPYSTAFVPPEPETENPPRENPVTGNAGGENQESKDDDDIFYDAEEDNTEERQMVRQEQNDLYEVILPDYLTDVS
ncbi:uncharacterized protein [Watersipora subatra]|uniref:uncharacterized protein isoform X2 n=1 Tax=Watersipora subatra TaxID=2589382 RepID=UPI00355C69FF